ncbi:MAG: hypothetical protein RO469_01250 [Thermincola sp.]|jgi:hypothetical protein|nr:hypothetical protein [Thermincola sp.]MDT3702921.1 hypothetical protein [Thermincola sp.]
MIFLLITVFTGIALFEVPRLIRKKYWRELGVFAFFLLAAFMLTMLQTLGIRFPPLLKVLAYVFKDLLHLSYKS